MHQAHHTLELQTRGPGLQDITRTIENWVAETGIQAGLLTLLVQHTSASITIQENADPDVQLDLVTALNKLAPADMSLYRHTCEGPDDMPAHIKSALTDVSLSIPVLEGQPRLGIWQGIYLIEHRDAPQRRKIALHLIGE
jgi:secondary thiamine-phosphate synthase enzyme